MINGIDVSEHQGLIDWERVANVTSFAIIRAGYGTHYDEQAEYNADMCELYHIPYGLYWFSYALNENDAVAEADRLIKFANRHSPTYPLYYDFEYDSHRYANKNGVEIYPTKLRNFATKFCDEIESAGYYAGIYANQDYKLNWYGNDIFERYDIWYCDIDGDIIPEVNLWQYSFEGAVDGINGNVDLCTDFIDFPKLLKECNLLGNNKETNLDATANEIIARQVIQGRWGNGDERKRKLQDAGFDYEVVQTIVNAMLGR